MAFAAIAALIAGAEVTAPLVLAAVAEVGTALTVVGAVTGSKDLLKIGGIMGLVGGVGGLVAGASGGAAGAAGAANTADAAGSDGIISSAVDSSPSGAPSMAADASAVNPTDLRLAAGTQASPGAADLGMDPTQMATTGGTTDPSALAGDTSGMNATGSTVDASSTASTAATDPWSASDPSLNGAAQSGSQPIASSPVASVTTPAGSVETPPVTPPAATPSAASNPTDMRLAAGTQASPLPSNAPVDTTSYLQKMMSFLQDPKNKSMIDLGSKLVGGALQGAQQQDQFNQRLNLEQQRINQTSYGSQVGQNRRHGIISGARA